MTAVEPTSELRETGQRLHPSPRIEWIDDILPELTRLSGREGTYDLVLLTAVLMHLDAVERSIAMGRIAALARAGGVVVLSLRHGPVPDGRRMFDVTADETIDLAQQHGLRLIELIRDDDSLLGRPGVTWSRLALRKQHPGQDGSAARPLTLP